MNCPTCNADTKRFGKHRNGLQRYRCLGCRKTFTEPPQRPFRIEDYLNEKRGLQAVRMLTEGCSIRTVERLTEIRRDTKAGAPITLNGKAASQCARDLFEGISDLF